jgi:hypothetical protein
VPIPKSLNIAKAYVVLDIYPKLAENKSVIYRNYCMEVVTAKRLKAGQGQYGEVEEVDIFQIDGVWYGPINLVEPNEVDIMHIESDRKAKEAEVKIKAAGITDDEIEMYMAYKGDK